MELSQNKGALAKLLAGENITVTHNPSASTAYFDVENRVLVCPVWKDMSGDLYDLLMGHEVGHALWTPMQGWHDAVCDDPRPNFKTFLNVVEDARIERKVQSKYPGLRSSFVKAYKELNNKKFFGDLSNVDIGKFNLIDRVNIHFKMGSFIFVPFAKEEHSFIERMNVAETFDDVLSIANDIYNYVKENEQNKINENKDLLDSTMDHSKFDKTVPEMGDEIDIESDDNTESQDQSSSVEQIEESSNDDDETEESDAESESDSEFIPDSVTDKNFREHEIALNDTKCRAFVQKTIPNLNPKDYIITSDIVHRSYVDSVANLFSEADREITFEEMENKEYSKFFTENKPYINMLVKEFEMRKNAKQYSRSLIAKTGELDMRNVAKYRFTNDLFRKVTQVEKGKSHGMVMILDMSSSMMGDNIAYSIYQVLNLAIFCKKVNIPFSVYGFTNAIEQCGNEKKIYKYDTINPQYQPKTNELELEETSASTQTRLVELITSNVSPTQFVKLCKMLCVFAMTHNRRMTNWAHYDYWMNINSPYFCLGTTPLIETIALTRNIVHSFQKNNNVDIMNVIFLTDGDGTTNYNIENTTFGKPRDTYVSSRETTLIMEDIHSNKKIQINGWYGKNSLQKKSFEYLKEFTGARIIGYYLSDRRTLSRMIKSLESREFFKKNGYYSETQAGFDEYYHIAIDEKKTNSSRANSNAKNTLYRDFMELNAAKANKKMLAAKFAEKIAA